MVVNHKLSESEYYKPKSYNLYINVKYMHMQFISQVKKTLRKLLKV